MRELLDSDDYIFRFEIGVTDAAASLEDCKRIVTSISKYYIIKAELDQLVEGLRVLGVHDVMTLNPHAFRNLLTAPDVQIDADYILNLFSTQFSEPGCNRREIEEQAIIYWVNFIQLIECKHKIYPLQCFSPPIIKHNIMCENAFWGGVRIPIQLPPTKLILH